MDEERDQPHFPFDEGRSFTLRIEVADEGFRTYVNGKPYVNFSHRLDLGNVHYLYLTEGAEFYDISYQDRYVRNKDLKNLHITTGRGGGLTDLALTFLSNILSQYTSHQFF